MPGRAAGLLCCPVAERCSQRGHVRVQSCSTTGGITTSSPRWCGRSTRAVRSPPGRSSPSSSQRSRRSSRPTPGADPPFPPLPPTSAPPALAASAARRLREFSSAHARVQSGPCLRASAEDHDAKCGQRWRDLAELRHIGLTATRPSCPAGSMFACGTSCG